MINCHPSFDGFGIGTEHRGLARETVRKSLVLLKNGKSTDKPLLPLSKKAPKILVAGSHADNLGYQYNAMAGLSSGNDLTIATQVIYNENPDAGFVKSGQ
ncbi:hypothetical protein IFM89_010137 [Coptis chinensis]|uniref:beta-glucosidase n=1 Tax=Coptis chinensis TaxID=261450 RepID=A0A835I8Y3_9MAGN|nr:hypothetical protein IFM89_010137 [Coptis chinensis]